MTDTTQPKSYEDWGTDRSERKYDAAYTFGYHVMQHCRSEALKEVATAGLPATVEELQDQVAKAVDTALHNVMDLLEGFWPTKAGPNYGVHYALAVCVTDESREEVERIFISPCLMDLPIGYWAWKDGQFRNLY
jgi:hypothetical protein